MRPVNCWTSFTLARLLIPMIAAHLSGFASMPVSVTKKPRNFPDSTLNTYLFGLSFKLSCFCPSRAYESGYTSRTHPENLITDNLRHCPPRSLCLVRGRNPWDMPCLDK